MIGVVAGGLVGFGMFATLIWRITKSDPVSPNIDKAIQLTDHLGIKKNERRFLLVGKTGVGKSTTANTILGSKRFKTGMSGKSVTAVSTFEEADRFHRHLVVVDSPGLCDTGKSDELTMKEIKKFYGMTAPGLHAVVFVVKTGRFTNEDEEALDFFLKHFGEAVINFLIIVFTGKEDLEEQDQTIEGFIRSLEEKSGLRDLLERIQNRYVVFGKSAIGARDEEVKTLLEMIDEMVRINGQHFYTNECYKKAEEILSKEIVKKLKLKEKKLNNIIQNSLEKMKHEHENNLQKMRDEQKVTDKIKDEEIAQANKQAEEAEAKRLQRDKEIEMEKAAEEARREVRQPSFIEKCTDFVTKIIPVITAFKKSRL